MYKDLLDCESEPIQFPGAVQPHGVLLVLAPETRHIEAASESSTRWFGHPAQSLLEKPLDFLFSQAICAQLLDSANLSDHRVHQLVHRDRPVFVQLHNNTAGHLIMDLEPGTSDRKTVDLLYQYRRGIAMLRQLDRLEDVYLATAVLVKDMTGFDRVMVYRFDSEANGEVIAEACSDSIEPYLGLRFPAADIPRQARELFTLSKVRHIPDTAYQASPLIAHTDIRGIDIGHSSLRSVSGMHIEYLHNMKVHATLMGSLVVNGKLWGLISCQHKNGPKTIDPLAREIIGWLCDDISAVIREGQLKERHAYLLRLAERRRLVVETIRRVDFRTLVRQGECNTLLEVVGADGFSLLMDEGIESMGTVPEEHAIRAMNRLRLQRQSLELYFATNSLAEEFGTTAASNTNGIAGALFMSVHGMPGATMVWFRREQEYTVRWGRNPEKPLGSEAQSRLSPRKSFDHFLQHIRGKSIPWIPDELESAIELGALIEIDALREKSAFTQTVLNSIPAQIAVLDGNGVIGLVNNSWRQFAIQNGAPELASHSIGLNYLQFCNEDKTQSGTSNTILDGISSVLKRQSTHFSLEYPCDSPDTKRFFRMNVYPMIAPYEGALVAHEDISERKAVERALMAAKADAQKANLAKTRFLAAASHDLRQPLSALSLYIGVLQHGPSSEYMKIVSSMQTCCEGLMELLSDLLDVTKLESGIVKPILSEFSLENFVAALVSIHSVEAKAKGLQLRTHPCAELIYTDIQLLNRICSNLLSNAIRYTIQGGVLVAPRRHCGKLWLEFWDTGEGIPIDKSDLIFEEFVQLGGQGSLKGSGLGLAIVSKAATLLNLEIRMRSLPGHGSMFAIELPVGCACVETVRTDAEPEQRSLRVALIEDNVQVLESLVVALQAAGHQVVAATSAGQLFAELGSRPPEVLISDYRLAAGQNGYEVIKIARELYGESLPAIMINGDTDPDLVKSMAQRGIFIHYKPLRLEDLLSCVKQAVTGQAP